ASGPAGPGEGDVAVGDAGAAGGAPGGAAEAASGRAISTSAGAGAVGSKPTANTQTGAAAQKRTAASSTGMGATGARPTTAPPTRPAPSATPAPRQATPDQIQAALARIGMTRPGTSGFSAGRTDGVHTKLDERMQMREASVFPLSGRDLETVEAEEWTPEQTYSDYENLSAAEYDADMTAPIMNRDALWDGPEDVSTQQMPIVPDPSEEDETADAPTQPFRLGAADDDATDEADVSPVDSDDAGDGEPSANGAVSDDEWFLGGVFTTREEQIRRQRAAFERERALEKRRAEAARREDQAAASATVPAAAATGAAASGRAASGGAASGGASPSTAGADGSGGGSSAGAAAPASTGGRSPRERRRITFLVLAALLVVVVVIGFFVFGGSSDDQPEQTAQPTQEATAAPDEGEDEEDEPEAPAPEVASVEAIDPEGDDEENSDAAELVLPGAEGGWQSERYNSPEFGGLKSGLGLMFEL